FGPILHTVQPTPVRALIGTPVNHPYFTVRSGLMPLGCGERCNGLTRRDLRTGNNSEWSMIADGFEDFPADACLDGERERGNVSAPAEADRLTQRGHEELTVGTGSQVLADLLADRDRQILVQVGGQASEHFNA